MNGNDFKIPNMGSIAVMGNADNRMSNIIANINESAKAGAEPAVNESVATVTCPMCGAQFTYDNVNNDGSHPTCPICNFEVKDQAYDNSAVEPEAEVNESIQADAPIVNEAIDQVLAEYFNLLESDASAAKALLENAGLAIEVGADGLCTISESTDAPADMNEKTVSVGAKIVGGKLVKKHKTKLSPKQLKARAKAMKKNARKMARAAHKGAAIKKRKKSMKIRRKKLGESYAIIESIMDMLSKEGVTTISRSAVSRLVNESMANTPVNESDNITDTDQMVSAVETILNNKGLEVLDTGVEVEDGVTAIEVMVQDIDADIYLGEISDEIAEMMDCEVDYDEPEADKDDESLVDLVFYLVPRVDLLQEKKNCNEEDDPDCKTCDENCGTCDKKDEACGGKKKNEACGMKKKNEGCGGKKNECDGPKNESMTIVGGMTLNESFDTYAGGSDNIRCRLNPAFIKPGQIIYDADQHTVFKALTEAVHHEDAIGLSIDVLNSDDQNLAGISGAEVSITPGGNYYLLKSNPVM